MATVRALIVGVSDYSQTEHKDLAFCVNDISAVEKAFINGLNVEASNIYTCGKTGAVSRKELASACANLMTISSCDDTVLFYFSGHGAVSRTGHQLELSDTHVKTQEMIAFLESVPAKNKVIFLDCCMAGDFTVNVPAVFNLNSTADEFAGNGYAVIASSGASQISYGHPEKSLSLFTSFLCEVLTSTHFIKEGKKSLFDFKPKVIEDNEEMQKFIEMCFDPKSPMNDRLKQTLLEMMKGGNVNE